MIPFSSGWMGENRFQDITVPLYGVTLLGCAFSYYLLTVSLLKNHDSKSSIHHAVGRKIKERASLILYVLGLILSVWFPKLAVGVYRIVALMWLVPDMRIEKELNIKEV